MDITKWLQDTATAIRPTMPRDLHASLRTLEATTGPTLATHPSGNNVHGRKITRTDSSILAPDGSKLDRLSVSLESRDHSVHVRENAPVSSTGSLRGIPSNLSGKIEPYGRRKRRKTRLDRYNPNLRRLALNNGKSKGDKKQEQRKSPRKARGQKWKNRTTIAPVVRKFQADNVKLERLTLPASNLGPFRKGRATSPFRTKGLPDLTFAEMSFLQNREQSNDASTKANDTKTKRNRARARQAEERMSAYFVPVGPALSKKGFNVPTQQQLFSGKVQSNHGLHDNHPIAVSEHSSRSQPQVQLPSEVQRWSSTSASYFTWSESVIPKKRRDNASNPSQKSVIDSVGQVLLEIPGNRVADRDGARLVTVHDARLNDRGAKDNSVCPTDEVLRLTKVCKTRRRGTFQKHLPDCRKAKEAANRSEQPLCIPQRICPAAALTKSPGSPSLPSSPPLVVLKPSRIVDEPSNRVEAATWTPSAASGSLPDIVGLETNEPRSSSPLGKLLKDCTLAFAQHGRNVEEMQLNLDAIVQPVGMIEVQKTLDAVRVVENECRGNFSRRLCSYVETIEQTAALRSTEDFSHPEIERLEFDKPVQVQHGPLFNPMLEYEVARQTAAATTSTVGFEEIEFDEDDGTIEEAGDLDIFVGFWRPNILY